MAEDFPQGNEQPISQDEGLQQQPLAEGGHSADLPVTEHPSIDAVPPPALETDAPQSGEPTHVTVSDHSDEGVNEDTRPDESQAWDMAHDEKYRREGKTEFLEDPKEARLMAGTHKSAAIDDLYKAYLNGEHVSADFNGEGMSSREIGELGVDGAYEKYFGYDREGYKEHDRLEANARSAQYALTQFEETYSAKKEVPKLVEQSVDLIDPDIKGEWRECLEVRATDLYHGSDSRSAIALMKAHSQGASQAELKQMLDEQGHSGASHGMTLGMIKHFYKEGGSLAEML